MSRRQVRKRMGLATRIWHASEKKLGRKPTAEECMQELQSSPDRYGIDLQTALTIAQILMLLWSLFSKSKRSASINDWQQLQSEFPDELHGDDDE